MPARSGRSPTEFSAAKGLYSIPTPTQSRPPISPIAPAPLDTGGVFFAVVPVALTAMAANSTVTVSAKVALSTFPSPIVLGTGTTGYIVPVVALAKPPGVGSPLVSLPVLQLSAGSGSVPGGGFSFILYPGNSYSALTLLISLPVSTIAAIGSPQTLQLSVWAVLLGKYTS